MDGTMCRHCGKEFANRAWGLGRRCYDKPEVVVLYRPPPKPIDPAAKVCRHCKRANSCRPRQLCWPCYYRPGVKERYPVSDSKYARKGVGNGHRPSPLPDPAPGVFPGTEEKIRLMEARAAAGLAVCHPNEPHVRTLPHEYTFRGVQPDPYGRPSGHDGPGFHRKRRPPVVADRDSELGADQPECLHGAALGEGGQGQEGDG